MVFVTAPDANVAANLTKALLSDDLVACGNIVDGIRSVYRWEGKVCDDSEALLILKTTKEQVERLKNKVVEIHPYECPEVLAVPVLDGHHDYLSWVRDQVR
jgi:periplasmic divalent cation tolerance protein